jgi:hypothetical protein
VYDVPGGLRGSGVGGVPGGGVMGVLGAGEEPCWKGRGRVEGLLDGGCLMDVEAKSEDGSEGQNVQVELCRLSCAG